MRRSFGKFWQRFSTPSGNRLLPNRRPLRVETLEGRWLLSIGTLHVDADSAAPTPDGQAWETAYPDLQDALDQTAVLNTDADAENDITAIWIAEGAYRPTTREGFSMLDAVSLYGGFFGDEPDLDSRHGTETILSGDLDGNRDAYHVVYANNVSDVTLDTLTVTDGSARNSDGGGIYNDGEMTVINSTISENSGSGIRNSGTLTVTNSTISDNTAGFGGGIHNDGELTFTNSTISDNLAHSGGGIYNLAGLTVTNSTISGNEAKGITWPNGGGIYNSGGTVTITGSTISENSSGDNGGGIYSTEGSFTIINSTISGNSAEDGAGIRIHFGTLTIIDSTISGNTTVVTDFPDFGGGIYSWYSETIITGSTISGNWAHDQGGGIVSAGGQTIITGSTISGNSSRDAAGILAGGTMTVANSTISGNSAGRDGGGIRGTLTVTNSTIAGNSAGRDGGGIHGSGVTLHNTIVAGNTAGEEGTDVDGPLEDTSSHNLIGDDSDMSGIVHGENGNLVGTAADPIDPRFVRMPSPGADGQWGTEDDDYGDLHLLPESPAIDAGDDAQAVDADGNPLLSDLDGNPRILGGSVDMGAYESLTPGDILGTLFNDHDGDGIRDDHEPGIPRWKIYLDQNENGLWDPDELFAMTGPHGGYSFTELPVGTYSVGLMPRSGWTQTLPDASGFHTVTLEPGQTVEDALFGNSAGRSAAKGANSDNRHVVSEESDWLWQLDLPTPKSSRESRSVRAVDELMAFEQ